MSDVTTVAATDSAGQKEASASLWSDARRQLIRNPLFVASFIWVLIVSSMALFPRLWTSMDPRDCDLSEPRAFPSAEHWFGTNTLGCDYYTHAIFGARPSLSIALLATGGVVLIGVIMGLLAGFFGRWIDTLISRFVDILLGIPFLLGAVVFLSVIKIRAIWTIALVLILLGWTVIARIMRGNVLASKNLDYVHAAKALGASNSRLMARHILPNAIAPVVVYATILLGAFVGAEATLSFLGVGLQAPSITWGIMITQHDVYFLQNPWLLIFPAGMLFLTVLSFVLMGDALRDALDPRLR